MDTEPLYDRPLDQRESNSSSAPVVKVKHTEDCDLMEPASFGTMGNKCTCGATPRVNGQSKTEVNAVVQQRSHPELIAYELGAKGATPSDRERRLFEAWMAGHCWTVGGVWDGTGYTDPKEQGNYICPEAMRTRQLWAAWRDRAALKERSHPEPVAWIDNLGNCTQRKNKYACVPLYAHPPEQDKDARIRELCLQRDVALAQVSEQESWIAELEAKLEVAREALSKLAYVEGNGVARQALNES